jgi:hypothetical protein
MIATPSQNPHIDCHPHGPDCNSSEETFCSKAMSLRECYKKGMRSESQLGHHRSWPLSFAGVRRVSNNWDTTTCNGVAGTLSDEQRSKSKEWHIRSLAFPSYFLIRRLVHGARRNLAHSTFLISLQMNDLDGYAHRQLLAAPGKPTSPFRLPGQGIVENTNSYQCSCPTRNSGAVWTWCWNYRPLESRCHRCSQ